MWWVDKLNDVGRRHLGQVVEEPCKDCGRCPVLTDRGFEICQCRMDSLINAGHVVQPSKIDLEYADDQVKGKGVIPLCVFEGDR